MNYFGVGIKITLFYYNITKYIGGEIMLQKYDKYDYRVQLMRILACFIVIGCHVRAEPVINGGLDKELLLIHGFFDDGVAVFFLIMGFFLPSTKEPFWKSIGKTFCRILIPVLILKIGLQVLGSWIIHESSLLECLAHPALNLTELLHYFVSLNFSAGNYSTHLWYITSYLNIVILLPLLKLLTLDHPLAPKVCQWIIAINVIGMFVSDLRALFPAQLGIVNTFMIFDVSLTYVLIGYVLYQKQDYFKNSWKYRILFLIAMVGINILRFILQCVLFQKTLENNYFYYWTTAVSLLFTVCFAGFFLTFARETPPPWSRVINYIGKKTYWIYLIHMAVYTCLDHRNVRNQIYAITIGITPNLITKLGYDLLYPIIIFICCLLISIGIDCIKMSLQFLCHRLPLKKA